MSKRVEMLKSRSPDGAVQGRILRLDELSFPRIESLNRAKAAVVFAVSPLEEHGPHLPVGTDVISAEFFNQEIARRILAERPDWTVLIGPPVPLGASAFDAAGTLKARARTVRNVAYDYAASLARHGFRYILLTNGHAGPLHVVALEEAAAAVSRRFGVRALSVSGPILWKFMRGKYSGRLESLLGRALSSRERQSLAGDFHAGVWETSLILLARPDLVDEAYKKLQRTTFTLAEMIRSDYPLRGGNRLGYIGAPAEASVEFAEAARRILSDAAWDVVRPVLEAENKNWRRTSLLYKIPFFRTSFPYAAGACGVVALGWLAFRYFRRAK
jgi:creatinine amidohydrolase